MDSYTWAALLLVLVLITMNIVTTHAHENIRTFTSDTIKGQDYLLYSSIVGWTAVTLIFSMTIYFSVAEKKDKDRDRLVLSVSAISILVCSIFTTLSYTFLDSAADSHLNENERKEVLAAFIVGYAAFALFLIASYIFKMNMKKKQTVDKIREQVEKEMRTQMYYF